MALIKPCKIKIDLYDTFCEQIPDYTQYDRNIPLEVTVMDKGEETDITGWRARIGVSKPDGTRVYREDLVVEGSTITTKLTEQVFAVAGMVEIAIDLVDEESTKVSLHRFYINVKPSVITDEVIKSSNDYQTIVNLIKEVRDIEDTFEQEQRDRAEAFEGEVSDRDKEWQEKVGEYDTEFRQQMNDQRTTFNQSQSDRTEAFNQQMETQQATFEEKELERNQAEQTRKQQEQSRQTAETKRETAEERRQTTETERASKETERKQAETSRANAETQRKQDENVRQANEDKRKVNETSRQSAEQERVTAETNRKNAEGDRVAKESQRQTAESNRATAETQRSQVEQTRQTKETERQSAEQTRQTKEQERQTKEQERITAEQGRVDAEAERNRRMTEFESRAEQVATDLETQTQRIEEYVNTNEERLLDEGDRTDYMGNQHESLKAKNDADVDWLLGEINTVHYDGQHITATDTIEGRSKSAILKGNTLVNLIDFESRVTSSNVVKNGDTFSVTSTGTNAWFLTQLDINSVKNNGKYILMWDSFSYTHTDTNGQSQLFGIYYGMSNTLGNLTSNQANNYIIFTVPSDLDLNQYPIKLRIHATTFTGERGATTTIKGLKILEYQQGMENWDIPYFEGMQSVKMPVLMTTGKNLFDGELENGAIGANGDLLPSAIAKRTVNFIKVKPNTTYSLSCNNYNSFFVHEYNENYSAIAEKNINGSNIFVTNPDTTYIKFNSHASPEFEIPTNHQIQFEESLITTSYEPFKSNILTVNEPVELRGIGDVRDELDLLTGEVTQRIGEVVLNGSENWNVSPGLVNDNYRVFYHLPKDCLTGTSNFEDVISDSVYATKDNDFINKVDSEYIMLHGWGQGIGVCVKISKLQTNDIDGFKKYLSENNIRVEYPLNKKVIKTVDLSDYHVYSYKGVTHYDCSSAEGSLVPTLSIDVPTNLPALVSRQRETIDTQKSQIVSLEKDNEELTKSQVIQDEEIVTSMLANTELFEMVLLMMPMSANMSKSLEVNPMVEVYVTLILKGEKTIEQVPAVIRDKVQAQLDLLTK